MQTTVRAITFDCADPHAQAAFWSEVVGRPVDARVNDYVAAIGMWPRHLDGPTFLFCAVPEAKVAKNRVHLDLETADRRAEVARLVALGAKHVADHDEYGVSWSVMTDPEGNEFCLADPHA